jgi:hypothetical protein
VGVLFGSPEVTAGGNALKFYASARVELRRREVLGERGIRVRAARACHAALHAPPPHTHTHPPPLLLLLLLLLLCGRGQAVAGW